MLLHLVHLTYQHDAVENRHTKEGDETYARRNAERHSAQPERPDATYRSKRNGGEHEERFAQILNRSVEQQQNDDERYRNHYHQALGGTLKILKLATIIIIVALWQFQLLVEDGLNILHGTLHVPTLHVETYVDTAGAILMRNLSRSRFVNHISQLGKRNALATSQRNEERLKRFEVALARIKTQNDVKLFIAFVNSSSRSACKGGFKNAVDFVHAHPISRHAFMVVFYLNLRQSRNLFYEDSTHARHILYHA